MDMAKLDANRILDLFFVWDNNGVDFYPRIPTLKEVKPLSDRLVSRIEENCSGELSDVIASYKKDCFGPRYAGRAANIKAKARRIAQMYLDSNA